MKKYFALLMALVFVMMFAACGGARNEAGQAEPTKEPESAAETDAAEAHKVTNPPEATEAPEDTEEPAPAQDARTAYAEIVRQRIEEYGAGELVPHAWIEGLKQLNGVSVVRLIDFDGDGNEELLLCSNKGEEFDPIAELWTMKDGEPVRLEGDYIIAARDGSYMDIASVDGKYYIVSGWYYSVGEEKLAFLTVENGALVTAFELCENVDPLDAENITCTINGEAVSSEEYGEKYNELLADVNRIGLIDNDYFWSFMEDTLAETESVIEELGIEAE